MQPSNRRQSLWNIAKRAGAGIILGFAIARFSRELVWAILGWTGTPPPLPHVYLSQNMFWLIWLTSIAVAIHAPTTNKALVRLVILLGIGVSWQIMLTIVVGAASALGIFIE